MVHVADTVAGRLVGHVGARILEASHDIFTTHHSGQCHHSASGSFGVSCGFG